MPRPPRGEGEEMTKMGHEDPVDAKKRDTDAARSRVRDLLEAAIRKHAARSREQAAEEQARSGHESEDEANLLMALREVKEGRAHKVEDVLRDYLPSEVAEDVAKLVTADRPRGE